VTTTTTGGYSLTDLTPGVYTLTVTATNYVTKTTQVTVVAGMVTQCDVALTAVSSGGDNTGGNSGSGDSSTTTEDYSSAQITSCDENIKIELLSCKRNGDVVTLSFRMTNIGLGDISQFRMYGPGGTMTTIWTDDNQQYYSATFSFNNRTSTISDGGTMSAPFPEQAPCSGYIKIKEVGATAKKLNLKIGAYTYYPNILGGEYIKFYNIPIY
jgi:hypothetical protein